MTTQNAKRLFKILIVIITLISISGFATAQQKNTKNPKDTKKEIKKEKTKPVVTDEEEGFEEVHPFPKVAGIGLFMGMNTVVQSFSFKDTTLSDINVSYEGDLAYGLSLAYSPLDYLFIEASYFYSKNRKVEQKTEYQLGPHIYHFYEISTQWIANPYATVNFFGTTGLTYYSITENVGKPVIEKSKQSLGFNIGVGFKININIKGVGIFLPTVEWKINWDIKKSPSIYSRIMNKPTEMNQFFSMPRFGLAFYPQF